MSNSSSNYIDADIAYMKYNTIVAIVLAIGGIVSLIVGAYVLSTGMTGDESAVFEMAGLTVTAEGIGSVIMGSSVLWAYFAHLSRPKYSRRKETKSVVSNEKGEGKNDSETMALLSGDVGNKREIHEIETATFNITNPNKNR